MSPNGRFAYTLYDGNGHPFVHALDTAASTARCIDLAGIPTKTNLWALRLHLSTGGRVLSVDGGSTTLTSLDTRSWEPPATASATRWWPVALALAIVCLLAAAAAVALRRRVRLARAPLTAP
jgi:hypothetical protein